MPRPRAADPAPHAWHGESFEDVVTAFSEASAAFDVPIEGLLGDDRPALSFDVVLITDHDHEADVRRRWRDAGAPLDA